MQAVILAAGQSKRFYPFVSLPHKSAISLLGKPLLLHTLTSLQMAGVTDVIIVVAPESSIPQLVGEVEGLTITYVVQQESLGMGHALLQAKHLVQDTFFLLSAYHLEFSTIVQDLLSKQKDPTDVVLLAKEDSILERYGVLKVAGDRVEDLVERPESSFGKELRVIGMYALNKEFLHELEITPLEHYHFEKALASYAKKGKVSYTLASQPTITLKYSWDLLQIKDYMLSTIQPYISPHASVSQHAILQGDVHISDGAKILEGACIKGPCFIGENVVIGNNAIVRNGVIIENHAVVGATMEVKNSILMEGVTTHTGFIGDSIIGIKSRLAAGFCTANVRLDRGHVFATVRDEKVNTYRTHMGCICGEYSDVGVNVATMPGVIVGNHVIVGPGSYIFNNIEDSTTLYTTFETVVKKK